MPSLEFFAHALEAVEGGFGLEHVVEQSATRHCWIQICQVAPGYRFDEGFAEADVINGLQPVGLQLGIPGTTPAAGLRGIEAAFAAVGRVGCRSAGGADGGDEDGPAECGESIEEPADLEEIAHEVAGLG